uniref:C-type lectin domain-containing protein n=1 Tax=Neogobius melanostomus TaxID=47308 RepID=A0A8C6U7S5_9GOBI
MSPTLLLLLTLVATVTAGKYVRMDFGFIQNHSWYGGQPGQRLYTFCYKVHAVRERLTWVEALQYCRTHHTDLASVASETEMMLIKKELSKDPSSDDVWIGLQFLAGQWLWVDGQPFSYESWGRR